MNLLEYFTKNRDHLFLTEDLDKIFFEIEVRKKV